MTPLDIPELAFRRTVGAEDLRRIMGRQKGECTWCGNEVPRGRRYWCSQACVDCFTERWSLDLIRRMVFRRDKGVCRQCGHDTQYWRRARGQIKLGYLYRIDPIASDGRWPNEKRNKRGRKNLRRLTRYRANWKRLRTMLAWEADHIVPVVRGGAMLGITNIQTLCVRCHKGQTKTLAGERAAERRVEPGEKPIIERMLF